MAEPKTKPTAVPVADYLATVENPRRRADAEALIAMMGEITGEPPVMWGPTMIGFGRQRYVYDTGWSGEMFRLGFAPRKANLVIYAARDFAGAEAMIGRLGKVKVSKACLYVNKLADVDLEVLRAFLEAGCAATAV